MVNTFVYSVFGQGGGNTLVLTGSGARRWMC